jgi:hypothetical protein
MTRISRRGLNHSFNATRRCCDNLPGTEFSSSYITLNFSLVGAGAPAPCRSGVPRAGYFRFICTNFLSERFVLAKNFLTFAVILSGTGLSAEKRMKNRASLRICIEFTVHNPTKALVR